MNSTSELLQKALELHRAGRLAEAEQVYRQILAVEPNHVDALHLTGLLLAKLGRWDESGECFRQVLRLQPDNGVAHNNLGNVLNEQGRADEAIECFRAALAANPALVEAHNNLGSAFSSRGQLAAAIEHYREAVRIAPNYAEGYYNLGIALKDHGQTTEAIACYREALRIQPALTQAQFNLAGLLREQGMLDEALEAFQKIVAEHPRFAEGHHALGSVLKALGRIDEAIGSFRSALAHNPQYFEAYLSLAAALQAKEEPDDAEACYRRALEIRPGDVRALFNLAVALQSQRRLSEAQTLYSQCASRMDDDARLHLSWGRCWQVQGEFDKAIDCYQRAITLEPENAEAHYFLGTARLVQGQFASGWPDYEWRLKTRFAARAGEQSIWNGENLRGEEIVVQAEWGLGDTLQFVRYAPLVEQRGGTVYFEVQAPLVPLLEQSGFQRLIPMDTSPPSSCRWRVPLLSLPRIFETTLETIPAKVPYLTAKAELIDSWRDRLQSLPGFKVGIHWGGSRFARVDGRPIAPSALEPLARVRGVHLISLQKHDGPSELDEIGGRFEVLDLGGELDAVHGAFMDTAAIIKAIDLVITIDSAPAHLAGALGANVWVALPKAAEWRWLAKRSDSPWYPTMRLFRQTLQDDWTAVIERMAAELTPLAAQNHSG